MQRDRTSDIRKDTHVTYTADDSDRDH